MRPLTSHPARCQPVAKESFRKLQYALTAHIRDPQNNPPPAAIEDRRIAIYRELFFNNVAGLLASTYPVLNEILGEARWRKLIREYFAHHQSHTPYFLKIPEDFLSFLENDHKPDASWPGFMLELAHYEWVELELSVAEDEVSVEHIDRDADLLEGRPAVTPLARVLSYRFPVHRIGPDYQPDKAPAETTWLVVARDLKDKVAFLHINQVSARLLELARDGQLTGRQILTRIAEELGHQNPDVVVDGGRELLKMLREKDIILGAYTADSKERHHG